MMTNSFMKYGEQPEMLKQIWSSLLAPEATLVLVEHHGLGANKLVMTSTEFGCIGIRLQPCVFEGYRFFRLPLTSFEIKWDYGEGKS